MNSYTRRDFPHARLAQHGHDLTVPCPSPLQGVLGGCELRRPPDEARQATADCGLETVTDGGHPDKFIDLDRRR